MNSSSPITSAAELIHHEATDKAIKEASPEHQDNLRAAGDTLRFIAQLKKDAAFQWFFKEAVLGKYQEANAKLKDPKVKGADLEAAKEIYVKLREIYVWLLENEMTARRSLNSGDPDIARLQAEITAA